MGKPSGRPVSIDATDRGIVPGDVRLESAVGLKPSEIRLARRAESFNLDKWKRLVNLTLFLGRLQFDYRSVSF